MIVSMKRASYYGDDPIKPCEESIRINGKWVIDIKSIEQLMYLSKKYKSLIIEDGSIKIYDDYVE